MRPSAGGAPLIKIHSKPTEAVSRLWRSSPHLAYPALPGLGYVWPTGPPALTFWCFPDWVVISHLKTKSLRKIGGSQTLSRQRLRLLHLPTLQTAGAHLHASMRSLNDRPDRTQIHVPAPLGDVMSVADVISKLRPLAADFAYACHIANSRFSRLYRASNAASPRISSGSRLRRKRTTL